jgi:hypothetical protein
MDYRTLLTPGELAECRRVGAVLAGRSANLPAGDLCKVGSGRLGGLVDALLKAVGYGGLLVGVPAGVAAHHLGRKVTRDERDVAELA